MRTLEQWDELLTCSPMSAQEALRSVRIKPAEIKAIQTDAREDLLERIEALEEENARLRRDLMDPPADIQELVIKKLNLVSAEALTQYRVALERCVEALELARHKHIRLFAKNLDELHSIPTPFDEALALAAPLIEKGRK